MAHFEFGLASPFRRGLIALDGYPVVRSVPICLPQKQAKEEWVQRPSHLWTVIGAFEFFGTVPANARWAWSARSPDGKTVAVTWWKDEIARDSGGKLVCDMRNHPQLNIWRGRLGNRDRTRNLAWARDHCDGRFRVVWCKAINPAATLRTAVERYPDKDLWMRLKELDESTGEFYATQEQAVKVSHRRSPSRL